MKKILALAAVLAAFAASAAITTSAFRAIVATPPASVSAGATATNTLAVAGGYKGMGEVCFACNAVAAASSNRTVTVYLDGTNTVAGGWYLIGAASYKGAAAGVVRVPFRADDLPPTVRMRVSNTTAASVVGGVLIAR